MIPSAIALPLRSIQTRILLVLCLLGAGLNPALAQHDTPTETVQTAVDAILEILRSPDYNLDRDRGRIRSLVLEAFDEVAMAQSVLSTNWRDASSQQQEEFQDLLLELIEKTYIGRVQAYTYNDERVEFRGEDISNNRAEVKTIIITDSNEIPVNYKLRQRSEGWFVYDIEIENVSMVSTYRETYRSVVKRSGVDGLLQQMRDKIAELEAGAQA